MATFISHSPAETIALGEAWGRDAASGLVIGLSGDLGSGKTQLVKGLARGLGIARRVSSPTFTLVNIYQGGRLVLNHLDLYRLDTPEQVLAAGLEEYLEPAGVTVVEWAERLTVSAESVRREGDTQAAVRRDPLPEALGRAIREPAISGRGQWRWIDIEVLSETERRIHYGDSCA